MFLQDLVNNVTLVRGEASALSLRVRFPKLVELSTVLVVASQNETSPKKVTVRFQTASGAMEELGSAVASEESDLVELLVASRAVTELVELVFESEEDVVVFHYVLMEVRAVSKQLVTFVSVPEGRRLEETSLCEGGQQVMLPTYLSGELSFSLEAREAVDAAVMCYKFGEKQWKEMAVTLSVGAIESISTESSLAVVGKPIEVVLSARAFVTATVCSSCPLRR